MTVDFKVADLGLAAFGRKETSLAEHDVVLVSFDKQVPHQAVSMRRTSV